jgi:hypothetical protein
MENPFSYFSNSLRETVWKIGMDSIPHSHESEKGVRSTLFSPLGAIKNAQSRPLQLFSEQFLEAEYSEVGSRGGSTAVSPTLLAEERL